MFFSGNQQESIMEDMELWAAYSSQVIALAAVFGATLGMLRKHDVLTADAVEKTINYADRHLPEAARPVGSNLLAHVRMMAEVAARDDPDQPQG
jgi:hypothetical protein